MISKIDIDDWFVLPVRELYKVKPRSYVMVPDMDDLVLFFDHIDGMYSYCVDMQNNVTHIAAWTKVLPMERKA